MLPQLPSNEETIDRAECFTGKIHRLDAGPCRCMHAVRAIDTEELRNRTPGKVFRFGVPMQ